MTLSYDSSEKLAFFYFCLTVFLKAQKISKVFVFYASAKQFRVFYGKENVPSSATKYKKLCMGLNILQVLLNR